MHDVIVCDEEFESAATVIKDLCGKIDTIVSSYLRIMENVCSQAVVSGGTADALALHVEHAKALKGIAGPIAQQNSSVSKSFLDAVDTADDYLY